MNTRASQLTRLAAAAAAAAAIIAAAATAPASASITAAHTTSVTVRYDPRDLSSEKGAERLLSLVGGAATEICADGGTMVEVFHRSSFRTCRNDAIARAVLDINSPTVTAVYDRRFAERGERGLRAAVEPRPAVAMKMVAVDGAETSTTLPAS